MTANPIQCKVTDALNTVVGKWKPTILLNLHFKGTMRFSELMNNIPDITQKMLTSQLRELEKEDLIVRVVYPQIPPKVEYSISEHGKTLQPIFDMLHEWGVTHLEHMHTNTVEALEVK
ncbi:winged helix-turn-helix transcriptional regulator [Paenibacillus eucommiae]|uniref:DNA-binding HxlR family transcriptional regulator n=1 Tax=Paenibacillus eucommiae TaxID=1355755 RepID=A0ABS4IPI9_9BACL|nr:helix-turn-helix domain-containing protein [Paenibacillus eucommiae]MBP1989475.1 DNA-binding HxlR family transcriptional regulator [Paenibacillus eucommiae]